MAEPLVSITLDPASRRTLERLKFRWGTHAVGAEADRFFAKEALRVAGRVARSMSAGGKLKRRTGNLARSITGVGLRVGGAPALRVGIFHGPALRYAATQEYGTTGKGGTIPTIRPGRNISPVTGRPTRALAVPTELAKTAAGVGRQASPVDYPEKLKFLRVNRGKLVGLLVTEKSLARAFRKGVKGGKGLQRGDLRVAFLLLRLVDIAPKHYLRDGMEAALPEIGQRLAQHLGRYLGGE